MSYLERLDYYGNLAAQFPVVPLRVICSKAGTLPAAAVLSNRTAVVDHTLYSMLLSNVAEARFLLSVLNSETARSCVADRQATGQ